MSSVNGDVRDETTDHYISISSSSRDKTTFTSSDDCEVVFDELRNVSAISLVNFEIPHTRYAIDKDNNAFYLSERISEGVFNFFALKAGTGGYTIANLAVTLELSQNTPIAFNGDSVLRNTYNFLTASSFGKVAIVSSGDVEYNIHVCKESLFINGFTKVSDTEASVTFLAPFEYIVAPGALLTLKLFNMVDRQVQVIRTPAPRTVNVIGDFAAVAANVVDLSRSYMVPYSCHNSVAEVAGFGLVDLEISRDTKFEVLGIQSPFAAAVEEDGISTPMIQVDFPIFVSTDDSVVLSGKAGVMAGVNSLVGTTHDDSHFEVVFNVSELFNGYGDVIGVSSTSNMFEVNEVKVEHVVANEVCIRVATTNAVDFSPGEVVSFSGLRSPEWQENAIVIVVTSVEAAGMMSLTPAFHATFTYPTKHLFGEGETFVSPVNIVTGLPTTYLSPNRFDLSRGRRVILCRASIDGKDLGTTHIPGDRTKFFGRIQLFSGADLVNFLSVNQAVGNHKFTSMVKRLRSIRFRFYNEDGSEYKFVGVEYTAFLKIVTHDSNTGL